MPEEPESTIPGEQGGDARCPPGFPYCAGCDTVFVEIEDIPIHDCGPSGGRNGGELFG